MSHFNVYKVMLGEVSPELLKAAIEMFARQIGATLFYGTNQDRRFSYGGEKVIVGFKANDCPYGISFRIAKDGSIEICGDAYDQRTGYGKYQSMIQSGAVINAYKVMVKARQQQVKATMQVQEDRIRLVVQNA